MTITLIVTPHISGCTGKQCFTVKKTGYMQHMLVDIGSDCNPDSRIDRYLSYNTRAFRECGSDEVIVEELSMHCIYFADPVD